ncbi:MAG TPA: hypothetical protein VE913_13380 [Longimicrobium sp.]|nr:hypothetical protein [Longimicrobium sp.]
MTAISETTVLLFFEEYEVDRFIPGDRYLKRLVRPLHAALTGRRHRISGFARAYRMLVDALRRQGYDVRSNDYRLARRNPRHPVGIFGYPSLLEGWKLPNPAVLGVGLYDHPSLAPRLMDDPRNRSYLVSCEWMREMFAPHYGDRVGLWFAGVDVAKWHDTRNDAKEVDILVYDKIRQHRDHFHRDLVNPIMERFAARGLRVESIRYGEYDHAGYRAALSRARALLYLSPSETQGIAYQEAMASNVPVLAWDNGFWLDPRRAEFTPHPVPASSVPYFAPECGEKFSGIGDFDAALDRFWGGLGGYQPRAYVARELSPVRSAEMYMDHYRRAAIPTG